MNALPRGHGPWCTVLRQVLCGGKPLPLHMSLLTVHHFYTDR
jgi:hypothetical protein